MWQTTADHSTDASAQHTAASKASASTEEQSSKPKIMLKVEEKAELQSLSCETMNMTNTGGGFNYSPSCKKSLYLFIKS